MDQRTWQIAIPTVALLLPFAGFVGAVVLLWERSVGTLDLALFAGTYLLAGLGVTIGYHRLLTHRSFSTHRAVAYTLAMLGSMAAFGPVIEWVADHRLHHAHTDREETPIPRTVRGGARCAGFGTRTSAGCSAPRVTPIRGAMRRSWSRIAACVSSTPRSQPS